MHKLLKLPLVLLFAATVHAQLSADVEQKISDAATQVLKDTGVPSASVAVVVDGKVAYAKAFGMARLQPPLPAQPSMAYPIGSISKQFTATAVLLLEQKGKLSIDDPVSKYFPELTRSESVTLRNLMTMTSGYEDFAPQDYIIPVWLTPIDSTQLVFRWASKPLDFEPGTQWQYSNTNYVLIALIVQKASGEPFAKFLREHVIDPAGLKGVFNTYTERQKLQVTGYVSNAMAPVRVQPLEANGWYMGDGDLAMPASTLAAWDITIMNRSLLSAVSYKEFETPFVLKDGTSTNYALGNAVSLRNGHRVLEHGGEVGGYVSENIILPDDYAAVVVLTNQVASPAASMIGHKIQDLIVPAAGAVATASADPFAVELKDILTGLQTKKIDRSLFTDNCNSYFNKDTLDDFSSTLGPMGPITSMTLARTALRGGMKMGSWRVTFSNGTTVLVSTYVVANGKIEQLLVEGKV